MAARRKARRGLPSKLERRLLRSVASTTGGRMKAAGVLRALSVLVRRHAAVAAEALGAGVWKAGRVGIAEIGDRLRPDQGPVQAATTPRAWLSARERRRFRGILDADARRSGHAQG